MMTTKRVSIILTRLVVLSVLLICDTGRFPVTGQQDPKAAKPADVPAEQKYKNIQVFKGLPSSQLMQNMFFMSGALRISCNGCHVNFTDFEKDDNRRKQKAREMIQMVRSLNQKNFGGETLVTCNTCHRGRVRPNAPLAFAEIKDKGLAREQPTDTAPVLTVDQILDRYISAMGGRVAQEKLQSLVLTGQMLSSEGTKNPLRIFRSAPNKFMVTYDVGWIGYKGFDGSQGWSQDNHGLHDVKGRDLAILKREAAFYQPLILKEQYSQLKSIGKETIDGRVAYVLEGELSDAGTENLYFDAETGLLVRITSVTPSSLGLIPKQIDLNDYREVEGIKMPFVVSRLAPDFSSIYQITEIKSTTLEDKLFSKPAEPLKAISMHFAH